MCSVNKFVQCVDEGFLEHSIHHIPTVPEFVLVGHDTPSLPPHMFNWIWAMTQINQLQYYPNCVVPVAATTKVRYIKKRKELVATNIKRKLTVSQSWQLDDSHARDPAMQGMPAQPSIMSDAIQELRDMDTFFADVDPLQMLWCIVPVEYRMDGKRVRRIVHVLKTIPAPGFDLMRRVAASIPLLCCPCNGRPCRCLAYLNNRKDGKFRNGMPFSSVIKIVTDVLNYECNRNLNIVGCFGRSHPLPHPMQVLEDAGSPMNPQAILSPFLVMR